MKLPRKHARYGSGLRRPMAEYMGNAHPRLRRQAARIRWVAYLTSDHLPLATSISTTAFGS
jgi:hypothetical protein